MKRAANNRHLSFLVNVSDTFRYEVDRERPPQINPRMTAPTSIY
jgi:hypothetical protein